MKKLPLVTEFLIATLSFVITSATAAACSCAGWSAPKDELENSAAVFAGKVLEIQKDKGHSDNKFDQVVFTVTTSWKGVSPNATVVSLNLINGPCDFWFKKDDEYLVYAYNPRGRMFLTTHRCRRTTHLQHAERDLAELGKGMSHKKVTSN
jgi:hypothetical protein